jgi:predicted nucleotidyltransferase
VSSLKLFGSAVRSDFHSDSDVDVLAAFEPGVRPTLASMRGLEMELERLFHRDVDLVREETLRAELRDRVEREAVTLL